MKKDDKGEAFFEPLWKPRRPNGVHGKSRPLLPSASEAIALAIGADAGLARIAGGGIMQQRMTWAIRGAGGPVSIFIMGMLPAKMGDGTLHTDEQLRSMSKATTRVRFQFRRDPKG